MSDWVCTNCKSINRGGAATCYSCGGARDEVEATAEAAALRIAAPAVTAAPAATVPTPASAPPLEGSAGFAALRLQGATAAGPGLEAPTATALGDAQVAPPAAGPATTTHVATGILAGVVAAVLASAIWYAVVVLTSYQVGLVAIAVGFLVGQAVVLGAGRRGSPILVAASVVLTLLALGISEYLIVAWFVGQEFAAEGFAIEIIQPIGFVVEVIVESISADPLTLAFWAIALFQAFVIPLRALRGPSA